MIDGNASPYRVVVPMTYATAAELFTLGRNLIAKGGEVVFDLTAVTDADSSALSVMLGWQRAAGKGRLRLTGLPESVVSLAKLYDIADLLSLSVPPARAETIMSSNSRT